eukprot:5931736-Amphidinium_carterae.1
MIYRKFTHTETQQCEPCTPSAQRVLIDFFYAHGLLTLRGAMHSCCKLIPWHYYHRGVCGGTHASSTLAIGLGNPMC